MRVMRVLIVGGIVAVAVTASAEAGEADSPSFGGYGEFRLDVPTTADGGEASADFHRFVLLAERHYSGGVDLMAEVEFEHGTTSSNPAGKSGSVALEFAYLDVQASEAATLRLGLVPIPMGFVNRVHEPPFRRGNRRPAVERSLIPTTWRELGAGLRGGGLAGVSWDLMVVTAPDAQGYGKGGIRGGRQKGNHARARNAAVVASFDHRSGGLRWGGSIHAGHAGQGREFDGREVAVATVVSEGHMELRRGSWAGRLLAVGVSIGDADAVSAEKGETVPEAQWGGYAELGRELVNPPACPEGWTAYLWGRWETMDLHHEVPPGFAADADLARDALTFGVDLLPDPSVVLKLDWTVRTGGGGEESGPLRIGAGFVY